MGLDKLGVLTVGTLVPKEGGHSLLHSILLVIPRWSSKPPLFLSPRKLHPLLEEKDPKNDSPKNYSFWTFAAHMTQISQKEYNFTQFAAFFHFLFIKKNY